MTGACNKRHHLSAKEARQIAIGSFRRAEAERAEEAEREYRETIQCTCNCEHCQKCEHS